MNPDRNQTRRSKIPRQNPPAGLGLTRSGGHCAFDFSKCSSPRGGAKSRSRLPGVTSFGNGSSIFSPRSSSNRARKPEKWPLFIQPARRRLRCRTIDARRRIPSCALPSTSRTRFESRADGIIRDVRGITNRTTRPLSTRGGILGETPRVHFHELARKLQETGGFTSKTGEVQPRRETFSQKHDSRLI